MNETKTAIVNTFQAMEAATSKYMKELETEVQGTYEASSTEGKMVTEIVKVMCQEAFRKGYIAGLNAEL